MVDKHIRIYSDLLEPPMCGIAGIVSSGRPDARLVRCMCDQMVHRGPDGSGFHDDDHAALGMRRLAIIDIAGSQQPVYNEDRTVAAVFNGEIYNFPELREQLRRARPHASPRMAIPNAWCICTRTTATIWSITCAGCSRSPSGMPRRASPSAGPGPGGQEAAVLAG